MSDTIIAIDLGRYKSVACVYHRTTRAHEFRTVDTTPAELDRVLARHPGAVVVLEACSNAGWVHDRAAAAGRTVGAMRSPIGHTWAVPARRIT
jgi:hypothetical protein